MPEWHIRYGGRGILIYRHVEKESTCRYKAINRRKLHTHVGQARGGNAHLEPALARPIN